MLFTKIIRSITEWNFIQPAVKNTELQQEDQQEQGVFKSRSVENVRKYDRERKDHRNEALHRSNRTRAKRENQADPDQQVEAEREFFAKINRKNDHDDRIKRIELCGEISPAEQGEHREHKFAVPAALCNAESEKLVRHLFLVPTEKQERSRCGKKIKEHDPMPFGKEFFKIDPETAQKPVALQVPRKKRDRKDQSVGARQCKWDQQKDQQPASMVMDRDERPDEKSEENGFGIKHRKIIVERQQQENHRIEKRMFFAFLKDEVEFVKTDK